MLSNGKRKLTNQTQPDPIGTYRNYCITWNLPINTEVTSEIVKERERFLEQFPCKFIAYQLERGTEKHRLHHQIIVITNNSVRHAYLRKRFTGAHIERCHNVEASIDYCTKSDTRVTGYEPVTRGTPPQGKGRRTDLARIADLIESSASIRTIFRSCPSSTIIHFSSIEKLRRYIVPKFDIQKHIFVLWGDTGTGKTRSVREKFRKEELFILPPNSGTNNVFFDYYDQTIHRAVLVDDYFGFWRYTSFLQIIDRYPMFVQTRSGAPVYFNPEYIIFTSNKDPKLWYPNMDFAPIRRRIEKIIHCTQWPLDSRNGDFEFRNYLEDIPNGSIQSGVNMDEIPETNSRASSKSDIRPSSSEHSSLRSRLHNIGRESLRSSQLSTISTQTYPEQVSVETVLTESEKIIKEQEMEEILSALSSEETTWNKDDEGSLSENEVWQSVSKKVKIKDIPFP